MEIDEPVVVTSYDSKWPQLFELEQKQLWKVLAAIIDVQHIGSTAIADLPAKPIVDILVGLRLPKPSQEQIAALAGLGYEYLGEAGVSHRFYFAKRQPQSLNVHLVKWQSDLWKNNLIFRDYLRTHPEEAKAYGQHKQQIFSSGACTLYEYSNCKKAFLEELLQRAQKWSSL
jgi:GrpB-like predicted nucleotidyltransferase (UPF0157 family)